MVCFGTARNPDHPTCDCPILRNLGFKLEKRTGSDSAARDAASRVATDAGASAGPAPAPAPAAKNSAAFRPLCQDSCRVY